LKKFVLRIKNISPDAVLRLPVAAKAHTKPLYFESIQSSGKRKGELRYSRVVMSRYSTASRKVSLHGIYRRFLIPRSNYDFRVAGMLRE
jgi:hypothetical protein